MNSWPAHDVEPIKRPAHAATERLPDIIGPSSPFYRTKIPIGHTRSCTCPPGHLNCLTPSQWLQCQMGVWQFAYEGRDIRDKDVHPATFPIALASRVISLFTHEGELVLDPFVGSGTTLVAARDLNRNAVGFDLQEKYIAVCRERLRTNHLFNRAQQIAVHDDARRIPDYLETETVSLLWSSPPYANLLNRKRCNKSRRQRRNRQFGRIEQYSQDPRDLGTLPPDAYTRAMGDIFEALLPLLKPGGHCVININDLWWDDQRITIHLMLIEELRRRGYELRNIIIWDKTNVCNDPAIFGWPSNYITMAVTFEYLLDFRRPPGERSL
jgi:DNA modification methylase